MEVIKRRGRPPKIKTEGTGNLEIKIQHSKEESDSDSDNDYSGGADGKSAGASGLDLKKLQKDSAKNFVKREKAATMTGGKIYRISKKQIEELIK
jgi:hypothetical protein